MVDVAELIDGVLRINAAAPAIEWQGRWQSWGELAARIAALRGAIDGLRLPPGARVGVMLRNRPSQLEAMFAVLLSGRCLVTVNPVYPDAVVVADIGSLELPLLIGEPDDLSRPGVLEATAGAVIALPPAWDGEPIAVRGFDPSGSQRVVSTDTMIEMLTSGTTGKPKRVALTRRSFQQSFEAALHYEASRDGEVRPQLRGGVQILMAPLTHIGGIWGAINGVAGGRRIVLLEKFAVESWRHAVATYRPAVAGATAAALRMILDAGIPRDDLASLKALTAGAAPVDPATIDEFLDRYGIPVLSNYGATEFAGPVAGWSLADFKLHWADRRGSVGKLHRGVEARVVEPDTGAVLAAMAEGVLELRSPQLADPGEWLRTTDKARLAEDGYLWITGRADAAIIRGGFKVHPADVVSALEAHPAVREAVVVGIPDRRLGQVPAAALMLRTRHPAPTPAELVEFLRDRLLPYQLPVVFEIVDDVPRTASMKPVLPEVAALLSAVRGVETA